MSRAPAPRSSSLPLLLLVVGVVIFAVWIFTRDQPGETPGAGPAPETQTTATQTTASQAPAAPRDLTRWIPQPVPASPSLALKVLDKGRFRIGYDERAKSPAWAAYRLEGPIVEHGREQRLPTFATDFSTAARVSHRDYSGSGYDRGHLCPAFAMFSRYGQEGMASTFICSNIIPQLHSVNAGVWEDIEQRIAERGGWAERFGVWVLNGPIYDTRPAARELRNGTWIPDACWMVVLRTSGTDAAAMAYIVPNAEGVRGPIGRYLVSIAKVEAASGLHLVDGLPEPLRGQIRDRPAASPW